MLNETQEVALQNLLVLGEKLQLEMSLHGLTLDDAVELAAKIMGGNVWDTPTIRKSQVDETFIVRAQIPGTETSLTIFCLPVITASPFGPIDAEEVMGRDG